MSAFVRARKLARSGPDRIDPTRIARGLVPSLLIGWGGDPEIVARVVEMTRLNRVFDVYDNVDEAIEGFAGA